MNQSKPIHNPLYEHFSKAAQTLRDELNLFGNYASSTKDEKEGNNVAENQREMLFLRSMLEYFYAKKVYPYATQFTADDFCVNFMENMTAEEFALHNYNYKKKYMKRVKKLCKKLQLLDQPHDQDAFDLGNRIWGTRSFEMLFEVEEGEEEEDDNLSDNSHNNNQHQAETMLPSEEEEVQETEKDKHQEGDFLNRYPFLKGTFRFGSGVGSIAVVSESAVESAVGCLGESTVKRWDDKWKNLQIQEMQIFLAQINFMRHQTLTLLDELQRNGRIRTKRKSDQPHH